MLERKPEPSRTYFNYQMDSRNWERVSLRPGDIIMASAPKVGSTWTLRILATLIHGETLPEPLAVLSPWVDRRFMTAPLDALAAQLEAQRWQRSLRSHLPFDALPYNPAVRFVCVGRDPRDVVLSLHNHYGAFTDQAIESLNSPPGTFPVEFERATSDIHQFIREWLTRANPNLPWETEGFPSWSLFRHVRSFWDFGDLPNVLFVHYQDLSTDLAGEAARIANFIGVEPTQERISAVLRRCNFNAMREDGDAQNPTLASLMEGGAKTFFKRGTSGGWREVFTPDELDLYAKAVARNLPQECACWLEGGRLGSGADPKSVGLAP